MTAFTTVLVVGADAVKRVVQLLPAVALHHIEILLPDGAAYRVEQDGAWVLVPVAAGRHPEQEAGA